jgi:hypothetical protein
VLSQRLLLEEELVLVVEVILWVLDLVGAGAGVNLVLLFGFEFGPRYGITHYYPYVLGSEAFR